MRIDVETDGRHSKVKFTEDWRLDAARRDLTVNSMFLSVDLDNYPQSKVMGRIWDFFGGQEDLKARRIRFVGDPSERIKEDYLRILRYFRFHGRLSTKEKCDLHDETVLDIIKANASGLANISGERCWIELKQILLLPSAPFLLRRMFQTDVHIYLGLPLSPDLVEFQRLWDGDILSKSPAPITCLAALLSTLEDIERVNERLKLSNQELTILMYILKKRGLCKLLSDHEELQFYEKELLLSSDPVNKFKPVLTEMLNYLNKDINFIAHWTNWEPPRFPVNGFTIMDKWHVTNKQLRHIIFELRNQWIDSNYQLTQDDLLTEENRLRVLQVLNNIKGRDDLADSIKRVRVKAKKARR